MSGERSQSHLKGSLCDVFLTALASGQTAALEKRLGGKAVLSDPVNGTSQGVDALKAHVEKLAARFADKTVARDCLILGADRDVAADVIVGDDGEPEGRVVVVAVRGTSREITVRLYFHADGGRGDGAALPASDRLTLPGPVEAALDALAESDLDEVLGLLESESVVVDSAGRAHAKADGAARAALAAMCEAGLDCDPVGAADDGRVCAVEGNFGPDGHRRPGVILFDRGDSGLFRRIVFQI
jgi:hypothetical protein